MYHNLKAEIVRKGLKLQDIADKLSISKNTLNRRISGKSDFTFSEVIKIMEFFPGLSADYLFQRKGG